MTPIKERSSIIGLMSGSSLDGVDLVHCIFEYELPNFKILEWRISHAETLSFTQEIIEKLKNSVNFTGIELINFDRHLGKVFGIMTKKFIVKNELNPDFISSHGHTIFHYPAQGFTLQIGHPSNIVAETGLPVIGDFRSNDVALDGQGAPFAPIVDEYLFNEFDVVVNMGGIINASFMERNRAKKAFDIAPCNQSLNYLANQLDKNYDDGGKIAETGNINEVLLLKLMSWEYFKKPIPKSLDNSEIKFHFNQMISDSKIEIADKLATVIELIALQLNISILNNASKENPKVLITGGGAYNDYLIKRCRFHCKTCNIIIPDPSIISYKEGLLMALMGLLRLKNQNNVLNCVTGSSTNHVAGAIYQGINKFI